jgi:hypothetical protein
MERRIRESATFGTRAQAFAISMDLKMGALGRVVDLE